MEVLDVLQRPNWSRCLLTGLKDLYATGQMFDVELVENSGRSLWAHSCVLAAACPMMKNAFIQTATQSPRRIFYADISIERWKQLLDFIYLGQVSISRSQIPLLLATAANLGLVELQEACQETLDSQMKETSTIASITPKRKLLKVPAASAAASTRKRNMLERIPPAEQVPIVLNIMEVEDGTKPKSEIKKSLSDDEAEEDLENESPEGAAVGVEGEAEKKETKKEESMYRCTKCNKDLPYGTSLFRHELRHKMFPNRKGKSKKGAFGCTKCPKKFNSKVARNCHERNHDKQPRFSCKHCDKQFFFEFVRDKHILKEHADIDPDFAEHNFECMEEDCNKAFPTWALLRTHRSRAHGIKDEGSKPERPTPCDICGKEVLWLNEHKKSVHPEAVGESREEHKCPECGKIMKYASSLKRHMFSHQEGGAVQCPHCDKPFNHPSSLWSHFGSCPKIPPEEKVLLKTTTKKYKRKPKNLCCEICNKTFTNLRNYRNHVDNHLGKYKHMCSHCGKKFQNTNHYSDHMNRHYGIKPYQCVHCEKTFASKSDMNQHKRQHTGERPFACPICHRTFVHRSNCYAHARKAHNKELATIPELQRAVKTVHPKGEFDVEEDEGAALVAAGEVVEEEAAIIITTTGELEAAAAVGGGPKGEVHTVTVTADGTEHSQESVQIAELLLAHQDKGAGTQIQQIGQTTYTTIPAGGSDAALNTVLVPQYMYSAAPAGNVYTSQAVATSGDFVTTAGQAAQQAVAGQQELKFCLYEG